MKGIVDEVLNTPSLKNRRFVRFTIVHFKPLSDQEGIKISLFFKLNWIIYK